jgi:hypothetical protein
VIKDNRQIKNATSDPIWRVISSGNAGRDRGQDGSILALASAIGVVGLT